MMNIKYGFVFPGQGVQTIGMGADLAQSFLEAKAVFDEVDAAVSYPLSKLMFSGDISELTQTQNAQPAIMAVSMAIVKIIEARVAPLMQLASCVAGHSLGEYTALCAAGVLSLADTAKLLKARGEAMTAASKERSGGMLALIGVDIDRASAIAKRSGCYVANDNCNGQIVLSGSTIALTTAQVIATDMQVKRVVPLAVMGAFHSPMMGSAAEKMESVLNSTEFKVPQIPIYFNVTGLPENKNIEFPGLLKRQITETVQWRKTIENMHVDAFIECGQGSVLTGLIRHIRPNITTFNGCTTEAVNSLLNTLKG